MDLTESSAGLAVCVVAALAMCGCELEGYGIIRDLTDGSNDTTRDRSDPDDADTGDPPDEPSDLSSSVDTSGDGNPTAEEVVDTSDSAGFDTGDEDAYETDRILVSDGCVCVCECECHTPDTGAEISDDTGAEEPESDTGLSTSEGLDTTTETGRVRDIGTTEDTGQTSDTLGEETGIESESEGECVIISEYVEGSSRNKGVEIYNCGQGSADLSGYSICLVSNDNFECGTTLPLEGSLPEGGVLTVCYTGQDAIFSCDVLSGVANFNGDDRLAIMKDGSIVDSFGDPSVRPEGTPWADMTLRRCDLTPYRCDVPFVADDYYTPWPMDDFSDFGVPPAESGCASNQD